ncbi:MAG: hypothetical protein K2M57_01200, partial [Paramuribaculum sp.]|nr:hypothetical protein [Paramuribaculum sp.]
MTNKCIERLLCVLLVMVAAAGMSIQSAAQIVTPITWTTSIKVDKNGDGELTYSAAIESGWHMYALELPEGGPNPTSVTYDILDGVELVGNLEPSATPVEQVDMVFHLKLGWWEAPGVTLTQKFRLKNKAEGYKIEGNIRFQGCNDESCIPPTTEPFEFTEGASGSAVADAAGEQPETPAADKGISTDKSAWWSPVT